jgi:hypothetical protein
MLAHLFALGFRASLIIITIKESSDQQITAQLSDIQIEAANLISRIEFHLGREIDLVRRGFGLMLREWFFPNVRFDARSFDPTVWSKKEGDIFEGAQRIISAHEAKIPFTETAAGREEQELAALEKQGRELRELLAARRSWQFWKRRALEKQVRELDKLAVQGALRRARQYLETVRAQRREEEKF